MRGYVAIGLLAVLLAAAAVSMVVGSPTGRADARLEVFNATITSVTSTGIVVEGVEGELVARGRWVVVADVVKLCNWSVASSYVGEGAALVAAVAVRRDNSTTYVLVALRQGDVALLRPLLLRRAALAHRHTRIYMSVKGVLTSKGGNYMVLERGGRRVLAVVRGEWIKAGAGTVTWSDIQGEFRVGDEVRIFCHHVLLVRPRLSRILGFNAIVWGYSGAIIDLSSGTTLSRA